MILAWDTAGLFYAARTDRLDVLGDCARGPAVRPWRNVTTQAVVDELSAHGLNLSASSWLEVVHVDGLDELAALYTWMDLLGARRFHRGEATVCAWAATHGAVAVLDDLQARRTAERHGLARHGSLWVIATAVEQRRITLASASSLVDLLAANGARYPIQRGGFAAWCARTGIVTPAPTRGALAP